MPGTMFYRPARAYPPDLPEGEMVITTPPVVQPAASGIASLFQYLFPAVGFLGSFVFVFAFHSSPLFILAAVALAVCSVGIGIIFGFQQRRGQKKQTRAERATYTE